MRLSSNSWLTSRIGAKKAQSQILCRHVAKKIEIEGSIFRHKPADQNGAPSRRVKCGSFNAIFAAIVEVLFAQVISLGAGAAGGGCQLNEPSFRAARAL